MGSLSLKPKDYLELLAVFGCLAAGVFMIFVAMGLAFKVIVAMGMIVP